MCRQRDEDENDRLAEREEIGQKVREMFFLINSR